MERIKLFKWSVLLIIVHLIVVLYFSSIIASGTKIPMQWNYRGEVGSYSGVGFGLWFLWVMNAFLVTAFLLFPVYSPRYKKEQERFDEILPRLTSIVSFFVLLLHLYILLWAKGVEFIQGSNSIFILIGLLFIFLGNILPKIPANFVAGVRTPWTLTSDRNWFKTHRVSGYVFVIGGVLMILRGLIQLKPVPSLIHSIGVLAFLALYPVVYSYLFYLKERREGGR